jgi:hypothetical protein
VARFDRSPRLRARPGSSPAETGSIAPAETGGIAPAETGSIVACFVNAGWGDELEVLGRPEWPRGTGREPVAHGLACAVWARDAGAGQVSACALLVDTHCVGVKEAVGPRLMPVEELDRFVGRAFGGYGAPPLRVPVELVRHLVHGAVEFARGLGFEPAPGFERCAAHLGDLEGPVAIRFGRFGRPVYVAGPEDDPWPVVATLERTVGQGNFDFVIRLPI